MQNIAFVISLSALSFMLTVIWGEPLLRVLRHFRIGKLIRIEEPNSNHLKMGTATMGGVLFVVPVVLLTVLINAASLLGLTGSNGPLLLPVGVLLVYAVLGAVDDWEGIRGKRRGIGMAIRTKFLLQNAVAIAVALILYYLIDPPHLFWPATGAEIELGLLYIPLVVFLIVGSTNAINFTDGMDGLAGLISAMAFISYGIIALYQGQQVLGQFCFTVVGALFGFLWFNVHPASMFMGDLGALALGGSLAVVALLTGQWLLLPLIAFIPVIEALSDVIQIGYFRLTKGKRFFKMAPIHYHFLMLGWSETQVVQRFWLISLIFNLMGVALAINQG
jgi:phospho-N-acetylmuramoyl-pentapeptide-transferase